MYVTPPLFRGLKMLSAIYIYCFIQMYFFMTIFFMNANTFNPDQMIRLLLKDQSNLGSYCLQYRLHMKEQTKLAGGNCQKYEINSIQKNNHNSLPTLYLLCTLEWTDRRTDGNYISSCFRLYHVIHWIFYMFERKPISFASII